MCAIVTPVQVAARAEEEPLSISCVEVPEAVEVQLQAGWWERDAAGGGLYRRYEDYRELVLQVRRLSRLVSGGL